MCFDFHLPINTNSFARSWSITDVYGLDDELLQMIPKPVGSLLLLFPITEKIEAFQKEKQQVIESGDKEVNFRVLLIPTAKIVGHSLSVNTSA